MKNKFLIILILTIGCLFLAGCSNKEKSDYNDYDFVDVSWTRETEYDTEYIRFSEDGSFSYYCACGEPVNDSDLCDTYSYNDKTKTINLNCYETTESIIKKIKIKKSDKNNLELDFDGDIRKFTKEENKIY